MKSDLVTRIALALATCTITLSTAANAQAGGLYTWKNYPDQYKIAGPCYPGAPAGSVLIRSATSDYQQCADMKDMKPAAPQQAPAAAPAPVQPAANGPAGARYTWKNLPDQYTISGPCYAGAPAGYVMIHSANSDYEQCAALADLTPVGTAPQPQQPPPAAPPAPPPPAAPAPPAAAPANPQQNAQAISYGPNIACTVGEKVLAEPGDHPATVLATSPGGCRVHYDDGAFPDSWVATYDVKPADINQKNAALAAAGPRIGRYNIAVGTGAYDGYLMINSATSYELFLPSGASAGKGTYTFNKATTSITWNSGPLTDPRFDGTQKLDGNGKMLNIRIGKRSVATNTGP